MGAPLRKRPAPFQDRIPGRASAVGGWSPNTRRASPPGRSCPVRRRTQGQTGLLANCTAASGSASRRGVGNQASALLCGLPPIGLPQDLTATSRNGTSRATLCVASRYRSGGQGIRTLNRLCRHLISSQAANHSRTLRNKENRCQRVYGAGTLSTVGETTSIPPNRMGDGIDLPARQLVG